jgi:hypothetical protein
VLGFGTLSISFGIFNTALLRRTLCSLLLLLLLLRLRVLVLVFSCETEFVCGLCEESIRWQEGARTRGEEAAGRGGRGGGERESEYIL